MIDSDEASSVASGNLAVGAFLCAHSYKIRCQNVWGGMRGIVVLMKVLQPSGNNFRLTK